MQSLTRRLRFPYNRWYANRRLAQYHAQARTLEDTVRWAMEFGGGGLLRVKTLQGAIRNSFSCAACAGTQATRDS